MERTNDPDNLLKRLETPLRLSLAALWADRLCRAFWPLWSLSIAVLAALAFGVQDHLPLDIFWYGVVALAAGLVWAGIYGWRRFRRPGHQ